MRSTRRRRWRAGNCPRVRCCSRLLEARLGKTGKREFVQVLRLLEAFQLEDVSAAVDAALARGVIGFDAVKHLLLCRIERRPARLDLRTIPICLWRRWRRPPRRLSRARWVTGWYGHAPGPARPSSENAALPTFLREYDKVAQQCAAEGVDIPLPAAPDRAGTARPRTAQHRAPHPPAKFPAVKSLDTFDFLALPALKRRSCWSWPDANSGARENVIALGNAGTGKTHIALGSGLGRLPEGLPVRFTTAASLAHELIEAKDERRLMRFQNCFPASNC